jgi:hypothetical protein
MDTVLHIAERACRDKVFDLAGMMTSPTVDRIDLESAAERNRRVFVMGQCYYKLKPGPNPAGSQVVSVTHPSEKAGFLRGSGAELCIFNHITDLICALIG